MALRGFQERKMLRKVVFSAPTALILWGIIVWMLWSVVSLWGAKTKLIHRNNEVGEEIENAEESRKEIEGKIESIKSEYGIDLEARGKFNLTKPGEKVVIFADEQKNSQARGANKNLLGSIWGSILDLLNFKNNEK